MAATVIISARSSEEPCKKKKVGLPQLPLTPLRWADMPEATGGKGAAGRAEGLLVKPREAMVQPHSRQCPSHPVLLQECHWNTGSTKTVGKLSCSDWAHPQAGEMCALELFLHAERL